MRRKFGLVVAMLACFLFLTAGAFADVLTPGSGTGSPDVFSSLGAGTIVAQATDSYTMSTSGTGILYTAVYKVTATGYLDFLYQVSVTSGDANELVVANFFPAIWGGVSPSADVGYLNITNPNTVVGAPFQAVTVNHGPPSGVNWPGPAGTPNINFENLNGGYAVLPGQTSYVEVIETQNTNYSAGLAAVEDNLNSGNLAAFEPVPEPASIALFGSGLLGLVGFARRRFLK